MNKNKTIALSIFGGIIVLALGIWLFSGDSSWRDGTQKNRKPPNWIINYVYDNKEPYGCWLVYELLDNYCPDHDFKLLNGELNTALPKKPTIPSSYVYIGGGLPLDTAEIDSLLQFVENGNTAFIAAESPQFELMDELVWDECEAWESYYSSSDTANLFQLTECPFDENSYNFEFIKFHKPTEFDWYHLETDYYCDEVPFYEILGLRDGYYPNFFKIPHGKGEFLFHTNPIAFTNFFMKEKAQLEYADRVFSYLPEGDIYWDELIRHGPTSKRNPSSKMPGPNPLKYVISQEPLKWAIYLLLIAVLLYVIFGAKRRQKIIPVTDPNANTSLEFVETVGRLYFSQNNHKQLAEQKMRHFRAFLRNRYHVSSSHSETEMIQKVAAFSGVDETDIQKIFESHKRIKKQSEIDDKTLVAFHKLIENFYQTLNNGR